MNQTENNVYDKLLYYLSHEGALRWEKFKDAINRLTDYQPRYRPSTYLRSIARLGHLDYDPLNLSVVSITPAAIVETSVPEQYVLVGSRTPGFIREINKCVWNTGGKFHKIFERYAPTTIILSDLTEDSFTQIESLGIHTSWAFSAKLSKLLPKLKYTDFPRQTETSLPATVKKFSFKTSKYELDNQGKLSTGLYEIPQYGPSVYILKLGSDQRRVPRGWGEWLMFSTVGRTAGFIFYVERSQTWCVKSPLQVPLIIDRCATLCSGVPPKLKNGFYHYSNVSIGVAHKLTETLHQKWEII